MPSSIVSQIDLIGVIVRFLEKRGIKDILHRELNTVIRCATEIANELAKPELVVTPGMGLDAWLKCDHTGASSGFMAGVLSGKFMRHFDYPHDPDDFSRCVGLLDACPELRQNIPRLLDHGPQWSIIVAHWDELESLYRKERPTGSTPKLMMRMLELYPTRSQISNYRQNCDD